MYDFKKLFLPVLFVSVFVVGAWEDAYGMRRRGSSHDGDGEAICVGAASASDLPPLEVEVEEEVDDPDFDDITPDADMEEEGEGCDELDLLGSADEHGRPVISIPSFDDCAIRYLRSMGRQIIIKLEGFLTEDDPDRVIAVVTHKDFGGEKYITHNTYCYALEYVRKEIEEREKVEEVSGRVRGSIREKIRSWVGSDGKMTQLFKKQAARCGIVDKGRIAEVFRHVAAKARIAPDEFDPCCLGGAICAAGCTCAYCAAPAVGGATLGGWLLGWFCGMPCLGACFGCLLASGGVAVGEYKGYQKLSKLNLAGECDSILNRLSDGAIRRGLVLAKYFGMGAKRRLESAWDGWPNSDHS